MSSRSFPSGQVVVRSRSFSQQIQSRLHPLLEGNAKIPSIFGGFIRFLEPNCQTLEMAFSGVGKRVNSRACVKEHFVLETDKFHIGSCTKAFVGTLIAQLEQKLENPWEMTLGETFTNIPTNWHNISISELMSHTAGIDDLKMLYDFGEGIELFKNYLLLGKDQVTGGGIKVVSRLWGRIREEEKKWKGLGLEERIKITRRERLLRLLNEFSPVEKLRGNYKYSNVGVSLAALILEEKMNQPFENLMRDFVFKPLNLNSAGFGVCDSDLINYGGPLNELVIPNQPWGHFNDGFLSLNPTDCVTPWGSLDGVPELLCPAGNIHLNMEDWLKFLGTHLVIAKTSPKPNIFHSFYPPGKSIQKAEPRLGYGGGWMIMDTSKPKPNTGVIKKYFTKLLIGREDLYPILKSMDLDYPIRNLILTHEGSNGFWGSACQVHVDSGCAFAVAMNVSNIQSVKAMHQVFNELFQITSSL